MKAAAAGAAAKTLVYDLLTGSRDWHMTIPGLDSESTFHPALQFNFLTGHDNYS